MLELVTVGGITFDYIFWVNRLPEPYFGGEIHHYDRFFGGRAPNVAVAAVKLGIKAGIISSVGNDFVSLGYKRHLQRLSIQLKDVRNYKNEKTKQIFIFSDPRGRQITFFYFGAEKHLATMKVPVNTIRNCKLLHLTSGDYKFNLKSAKIAHKLGVTTSFDPGNDPSIELPRYLERMLSLTDYLFMNEFEYRKILNVLKARKINQLFDFGVKTIVTIYKGDRSSRIYTQDNQIRIPAVPTTCIDPTGASDAYVGAFLASILKGYKLEKAGLIGSLTSAFVVEKYGAQTNLPTWNKLKKRQTILTP